MTHAASPLRSAMDGWPRQWLPFASAAGLGPQPARHRVGIQRQSVGAMGFGHGRQPFVKDPNQGGMLPGIKGPALAATGQLGPAAMEAMGGNVVGGRPDGTLADPSVKRG